jgi:hypothetical protein
MAEEWLKHLAAQIKEQDREPAEKTAHENHELRLIQEHGPVFWRAFADFLGKYIEDMRNDLQDDITLREGPLTYKCEGNNGLVQLGKAAFPFVVFSATPQYQQRVASITYAVINPKLPHDRALNHTGMPCRFEASHHGKVFIQLDGKPFHEPHEAAKYVMEKLFTLA